MRKIIKSLLIGIIIVLLLFTGLVIVPYLTNTLMPWERANAIETTLIWGGLPELPQQSSRVKIKTTGNIFTRTFLLEFHLCEQELKQWVGNSNRLKVLSPKTLSDGTQLYEVYPGEKGAIGGTVHIDFQEGNVTVRMSWS